MSAKPASSNPAPKATRTRVEQERMLKAKGSGKITLREMVFTLRIVAKFAGKGNDSSLTLAEFKKSYSALLTHVKNLDMQEGVKRSWRWTTHGRWPWEKHMPPR